mgnify:CR=1 FL=1|tara:strand:- start:1684 stop:2988 length:1305 start_codon:yes stop_codon:yes gene_type:complete
MKVTYLTGASVLIETRGIKILSDPWFYDGAFYGSWHHWPPFNVDLNRLQDIDYIYISHIHEDHLCPKSLNYFDKDIPVLIHNFKTKFLKYKIESLGFSTIEIDHGDLFQLKGGVKTAIFSVEKCAADMDAKQSIIDTFMLVDDGEYRVLNTNDCMVNIIEEEMVDFTERYGAIDLLMCAYTNASSYPQCTVSLSSEEMREESDRVKRLCYDKASRLIQLLNPKYYMPFAGYYVLGGKLAPLYSFAACATRYEAKEYFHKTYPFSLRNNECIVLNSWEHLDLQSGKASKPYELPTGRDEYINNVLSKVKFDYESDQVPNKEEIYSYFERAYERMESARKRISFETNTKVFIYLLEDKLLQLSMCGDGYKVVSKATMESCERYVSMKMDLRLLLRILKGPRYGHWDNADGGSHILYEKKPNDFERGLYHTICYFHG